MPSNDLVLRAEGISWRAGGRSILGPLSLDLEQGELLTVIGPNGAGKTTLLRLLAGLLPTVDGELRWGEEPYARISRRLMARRVAYVPQIRPLQIPLTVEELVLTGRYPYLNRYQLAPAAEDFEAVSRALEMADVSHLRSRPLQRLSGGECQAAYIAAALAQEAELLILDEPTIHLDPQHQRRVATLLARLNGEMGRTVVLATHDLHLAARLSSRVLALRKGGILACDRPGKLLRAAVLERLFEAPFLMLEGRDGPLPFLDLEG